MPGKHDPEKRFISASVRRDLFYKLQQEADARGIDRTSFVISLLQDATRNTELTAVNRDKVREETLAERKRRSLAWSGYEVRKARLVKTLAEKAAKQNKNKNRQEKKGMK